MFAIIDIQLGDEEVEQERIGVTESQVQPLPCAASETMRALCVDLDGTLVKSDTLVDSLLVLVRTHPLVAWKTPIWALQGKAFLKAKVAALVSLDVEHLPYNRPLLEYLEEQHALGRRLYLATGADARMANRIASHIGLFAGVLASDGQVNLTGHHKLASIEERFTEGFDYVGNAKPDLPLLKGSTEAMAANPDAALSGSLRAQKVRLARVFEDRKPAWRALLRAIRPHQWAKNILLLVPLFLSHTLSMHAVSAVLLAFVCFSLCASATYIVNDLLDIEADRRHPKKRLRPFASGDLSAKIGALFVPLLFCCSFAAALLLPREFKGLLLLYIVTNLGYSLFLKRVALVDVLLLSGLYALRLLAGGAAAAVIISPWLAGFSLFLFLSLAMVKRFSELQNIRARGHVPSSARGYLLADIEQLRSFGTASAYASVVVFSLYISGREVTALYNHASRMWLITPLMILWISRVWLLAGRGELDEDPVLFALTDRMSLVIGGCVLLVVLLAI